MNCETRASGEWWNYEPENVVENDTCKILLDLNFQTDCVTDRSNGCSRKKNILKTYDGS